MVVSGGGKGEQGTGRQGRLASVVLLRDWALKMFLVVWALVKEGGLGVK